MAGFGSAFTAKNCLKESNLEENAPMRPRTLERISAYAPSPARAAGTSRSKKPRAALGIMMGW